MIKDRVSALEARADILEARLRTLERGRAAATPISPSSPAASPAAAWTASAGIGAAADPTASRGVGAAPTASGGADPAAAPMASRGAGAPAARLRRPGRDLEEFLGGSVLAWLGGTAVVAGLAFLLTLVVSRGWLGE